jgi:hypothetical protein
MERTRPLPSPWRYEVLGFGSLIAMYWVVELPFVPTLILGEDGHAAWDRVESVLLTTLALLVGWPIALRTRRLASRVYYLEALLRKDPWSRRDDSRGLPDVLVASLGDGSLTTTWRLALGDWVQSIVQPEIVGRVVAGRVWRTASGAHREEYEIEVEAGFRLVVEGGLLRFAPLCEGRPMRFVGTRQGPQQFTILLYRCPDCSGTTELLL